MMMDDRHGTASTLNPTAQILTFLAGFVQKLDTATDPDAAHQCIIEAFSHITHSSSAALWSVNPGNGAYQQRSCHGSHCNSLPNAFPESRPLSNALSAVVTCFERDEMRHLFTPEVGTILEELLADCLSNVMVPLTYEKRPVGFCALQLENTACLHDATTASVLRLAAQISANVLYRWLIREDGRHAQALLRRTDRLRSLEIIAGGFAHEIRNPLTSIKTFVQLAPERREDARFIQEFSRVAVQDIHRIEHLLQEILDYARYMLPSPAEEDVNELVSSCLSFISTKASQLSLHVRAEFADRLPLVLLDRQQIKQVVINLLLNALDAAHDQGKEIVVRTFMSQRSNGNSGICVEVQDNGKGIPAEHMEHIFDPFFTTRHSSSAGDIKGLGLTIAHQIVREHNGDIAVESREGFGSKFRLFLPIGVRQPSERSLRE